FRDKLEDTYHEEEVYTGLLWISILMYMNWSSCVDQGQKEVFRALRAAKDDTKQRTNDNVIMFDFKRKQKVI
ncbi:MAG: hypothetical protein VYA14_05365, partial [Pseudomonadota bacterium]|nr:hypothetical protein [Pseudomonadota bacterium]